VNAPVQLAMPAFLEQRHDFRQQLLSRVHTNLAELDHLLAGQTACSRLAVEAGWYAVLRVPSIHADEELALQLLTSENVYVHPGHLYDFPMDGFLVVSLITPITPFSSGITTVVKFLS
jgi:aspartate/methionine/tyrosine aminotransferase